MTQLHTCGRHWVKANETTIALRGTNLGNWLMQELWMMDQGGNGVIDQCTLEAKLTDRFGYNEKERLMKLFRDNWITERDWDQLQRFGFNLIRLPIMWSLIEDEKNPKNLRIDAWHYIDWAIAEAKKRGIYVILDLHGVQGSQTTWQSSGCADQNKYWSSPEFQDRAKWLWQQLANRYKDEPAVAAYDLLNEPWGSTAQNMASRIAELYTTVRAIDKNHIILLPSHFDSIDIYGDPTAKGMTDVAFELHPYPGLFGDRPGDTAYNIHYDWLRCGASGTGGVCAWDKKIKTLNVPLLMGEFQPWQSAGLELGGKIARATYDTYASYGWAATSWAYKLMSVAGGQGEGTWGMVTNVKNTTIDTGIGLIAKASTWDCSGWNASFSAACSVKAATINLSGDGKKTYYLLIKSGALSGGNLDISFDKISITHNVSHAEAVTNSNFGSSTGWSELAIASSLSLNYNDSTLAKVPTNSAGSVLRITRPAGVSDYINGAIYQAITLEGGQRYTLSGVFKDNGSSNAWAEIYLLSQAPVSGVDVIDTTTKVDFTTAPISEIEDLFKSYSTVEYDVHSGLQHWLTTSDQLNLFN